MDRRRDDPGPIRIDPGPVPDRSPIAGRPRAIHGAPWIDPRSIPHRSRIDRHLRSDSGLALGRPGLVLIDPDSTAERIDPESTPSRSWSNPCGSGWALCRYPDRLGPTPRRSMTDCRLRLQMDPVPTPRWSGSTPDRPQIANRFLWVEPDRPRWIEQPLRVDLGSSPHRSVVDPDRPGCIPGQS
jgi:hypothetical protein